ncbi:MAG TPA: VOC family protein [Flavobacterium sp.]|jgi:predicted enzyme related to lactoylglutathione lyase
MKKGKVTGIGGFFFKSDNSKQLVEWYSKNLGLEANPYGASFAWKDNDGTECATQWAPFAADTEYFNPSTKQFMQNFRVDDLDALLERLLADGVITVGNPTSYDYGKFASIVDPEGNKIELWEPVSSDDDAADDSTEDLPSSGKVTGLGGVFFKAENSRNLAAWYGEYLGLNIDQYGSTFWWKDKAGNDCSTQWSPFAADTTYFSPSQKEFMQNFRVDNLDALLERLRNDGVTMAGAPKSFDYGKFAWIMDPEGNKIELWEPIDKAFT